MEKFVDIDKRYDLSISIVLSEENVYYVWPDEKPSN
jgi:hypothetical protein